MQIEELPPNKPKFGLIVGLFGATIIVILLASIFFIRWDGKHLTMRHFGGQQGSLQLPALQSADNGVVS